MVTTVEFTEEELARYEEVKARGLKPGGHDNVEEGVCLMEAISYIRGLPHSDRPQCVHPSLGYLGRQANDTLVGRRRAVLLDMIPRLVNTVGISSGDMVVAKSRATMKLRNHREGPMYTVHLLSEVLTELGR